MEGPHWRSMFDNKFLGAWDLPKGRAFTVIIERVEAGELQIPGTSAKKRKPIVYFQGKEKGLALNKTNAKAIAGMYGNDTSRWIGRPVAIYSTMTQFGDEAVECIRVQPRAPEMPASQREPSAPPSNGGAS